MIVRISKGSFAPENLAKAEGALAQRPVLEAAGVTFETITNHEAIWTITP